MHSLAEERRAGLLSGLSSAGELLQLFRTGEVATRSELQRVTGLARSTVAPKVDALLTAGYLVEDGSIIDGRGRPSTRLRVNDQATTILVADLGATHGRLAVGTPAGDVLVESVIESNIGKAPDAVLAMVTRKLDQLLKRSGRTRSSLRGTAIGVPGPVNLQAGRIARSISMPGWDDYPVHDHLVDYFGVPAVMDNDANLMGLGEQRRIYQRPSGAVIKVGTGIGASLIIDGGCSGVPTQRRRNGQAKITGVEETAEWRCTCCRPPSQWAARCATSGVRQEATTMRDVVQLVPAGNRPPSGSSAAGWALALSCRRRSAAEPDGRGDRPATSCTRTSGSARRTRHAVARASRWNRPAHDRAQRLATEPASWSRGHGADGILAALRSTPRSPEPSVGRRR